MSNKRALDFKPSQGLGAGSSSSKRIRRDVDVHVVPDIDDTDERDVVDNGKHVTVLEVPKPGTVIDRRVLRKAGPFIIGPELRHNHHLLNCMVQHLARKENSDQFYQLKVIILNFFLNNIIYKSSYLLLFSFMYVFLL